MKLGSCNRIPGAYRFAVIGNRAESCKAILQIWRLICLLALATGVFSTKAAEFSLDGVRDLAGKAVDLAQNEKQNVVVFVFLSVDCPISNRYALTLRKLKSEFEEARWILVYPNADESAEAIRKNLKEYEFSGEVWRDTQHALVRLAEVTVTPEAAVYLQGAGFVYHGRIDDRYVDFGKHRAEASTNDLRDVLDEIRNGKVPPARITKAIGCSIPKLKK